MKLVSRAVCQASECDSDSLVGDAAAEGVEDGFQALAADLLRGRFDFLQLAARDPRADVGDLALADVGVEIAVRGRHGSTQLFRDLFYAKPLFKQRECLDRAR